MRAIAAIPRTPAAALRRDSNSAPPHRLCAVSPPPRSPAILPVCWLRPAGGPVAARPPAVGYEFLCRLPPVLESFRFLNYDWTAFFPLAEFKIEWPADPRSGAAWTTSACYGEFLLRDEGGIMISLRGR